MLKNSAIVVQDPVSKKYYEGHLIHEFESSSQTTTITINPKIMVHFQKLYSINAETKVSFLPFYKPDVFDFSCKFTYPLLVEFKSCCSASEAMEDHAEEIAEIDRKIQKLENRINGYSEMRADGDISRETFLKKKAECEADISNLKKQRSALLPDDFVEDAFDADYKEKLAILKKALEDCKDFDEERIIPDEVIDAFVVKIVAHEDCLDWYLRFKLDPEDPVKCHVDGDKRKGGKTPSFAYGSTGCDQCIQVIHLLSPRCPREIPIHPKKEDHHAFM